MFHQLTNAQLFIALAVLVVVAVVVGDYLRRRKARTAAFRNRFGSEYDRAVRVHGSPQKVNPECTHSISANSPPPRGSDSSPSGKPCNPASSITPRPRLLRLMI